MHKNCVVHHDIKGENVLIHQSGVAKLADFGASKRTGPGDTNNETHVALKGTPYYMAPEQMEQTYSGHKIDVWALGGVALLMATSDPPWSKLPMNSSFALFMHVIQSAHPPPLDSYDDAMLPPALRALVLRCFTRDYESRPSADELLEDPFMLPLHSEVVKATETPAALVVVGASVEAANGVYDLEPSDRHGGRRMWTRRPCGDDRFFQIQWSTISDCWMIDEPGSLAPYRMLRSAAASTIVPLGGFWVPYQGDGNAQVPVVRVADPVVEPKPEPETEPMPKPEPVLQAAKIMLDDWQFDALDEPLAPTAPLGETGGLRGVAVGRGDALNAGGGFGVALLAPPGALADGSKLSLERAAVDEVDALDLADAIPSVGGITVDANVSSAVVCLRGSRAGSAAAPPELLAPVTLRLQHASALDGSRAPAMRVLKRRDDAGGDAADGSGAWSRVDPRDCTVREHHVDVRLRPGGALPSHVAVVAHRPTAAGNEPDGAGLMTAALAYTLMPAELAAEAAAAGEPNLIVWLVVDRDDTRASVAARMARRQKQATAKPELEWVLAAESLESLETAPGKSVRLFVSGDDEGHEETREYKSSGVAFHLCLRDGSAPARVVLASGGDEVDVLVPRPPFAPPALPPPPTITKRRPGGKLRLRLNGGTGAVAYRVEAMRLNIEDCTLVGKGVWKLPPPEAVAMNRFEMVYEGPGPEFRMDGVFGAYVGVRFVSRGDGAVSERSPLLAVAPLEGDAYILREPACDAVDAPAPDVITQLLQRCAASARVARVDSNNCKILSHRAHEAAVAFAASGGDGGARAPLETALHQAAELIAKSCGAGWLAMLLSNPPHHRFDMFQAIDAALFSAVRGGAKSPPADVWYSPTPSPEDLLARAALVERLRRAAESCGGAPAAAVAALDPAAVSGDLGLAAEAVAVELSDARFADAAALALTSPPSSSSNLALTSDSGGGVGTLDAWLSRYNLAHAAPSLRDLGVDALDDLRDFEEADIAELGLKTVECRRFARALREHVSGTASESGFFGVTPPAPFSTLPGVTPAPPLAPPPRGCQWHVFISHKQANAADQVHTMFLELQRRGCEVWYDMDAEDLTKTGMVAGIESSAVFVLFLSDGVLLRPYCQLEIRAALENQRKVLLVHEDDERHGKYDFAPRQTENVPADIKAIGEAHESIPYRRRKHEKEAFYGELLRRIHLACSAFS